MNLADIHEELFFDDEDNGAIELSNILSVTGGLTHRAEGGLIQKLRTFPDGTFPISDDSVYRDDKWALGRMKNSTPVNITFDRTLKGSNDLKRAFVYYLMPEFNPFGLLRSYNTTKNHATGYNTFEKYVFKDNSLSVDRESIALLTPQLLNESLDRAREGTASRHYYIVYSLLRLWINLSIQNLLPEEFRLSINFSKIDNVERQRDVQAHFKGTMQTWVPFSEDDLEKILNYSLFWTEKVIPKLKNVKDFIKKHNLDSNKTSSFQRSDLWTEAEEVLNLSIGEETILKCVPTRHKCRTAWRYHYSWVDSYAFALDKIRNGIFVLLALLTGMRVRELCALTFDDIYADGNGDYWIDITRFKTSTDPNYQGELDTIPLPRFIGEKVDEFRELKDIYNFQKQGYIFQSNKSRKVLKFPTFALIQTICKELMDSTGVENLHTHRFRKTIAEILIHRDERNIHIIRLLFGHKSYAMTLRYISRNPYLVSSVASALEHNFAEEFHEIVTGISRGTFSGPVAEKIALQLQKKPNLFIGKQLKISMLHYVAHLLEAGKPIFIQRVSVGTYCLTDFEYSEESLPPCLLNRKIFSPGEPLFPDPSNCQPECTHNIVLEKARKSIEGNIEFYKNLLETQSNNFNDNVKTMLRNKITSNETHLCNLNRAPIVVADNIIARSQI